MASSSRVNGSLRKTFYRIHAWAGFQLVLLSLVVLASGTFAVIGEELDWVLDSDRRIPVLSGEPDWDAIYATAHSVKPRHAILQIKLGEFDSHATQVRTIDPNGLPHRIFVEPVTGGYTGEGHWLSVQRLLRDFHRYLFILPQGLGLPLVTVVALVLLVQLVSGLWIIRRWLKGLVTFRPNKGVRVLVGDLHRLAGLWSFWFVLLMILTSLWYLTEWGMGKAGLSTTPTAASASAPENVEVSYRLLPPSSYIAAAKKALPDMRPSQILFPTQAAGTVSVWGPAQNPLVRHRANRVYLDPYTAEVLKVHDSADLTILQFVAELADPLHFGDFGGLVTKWLWFFFGLLLTGLAATGVWLTWRRQKSLRSHWHWANLAVLGISGVFGFFYVNHFVQPEQDHRKVDHFELSEQQWDAQIWLDTQDAVARVHVQFGDALGNSLHRPAIEKVEARWEQKSSYVDLASVPGFYPLRFKGELPSESVEGQKLTLRMHGASGRIWERSIGY